MPRTRSGPVALDGVDERPPGLASPGVEDELHGGGETIACLGGLRQRQRDPVNVVLISHAGATSGSTSGGTSVTITGSGFTGTTRVAFGAVAAAGFTVNSDTQITAVFPAQAAGAHYIVVTVPGETSPTVSAAIYTYH